VRAFYLPLLSVKLEKDYFENCLQGEANLVRQFELTLRPIGVDLIPLKGKEEEVGNNVLIVKFSSSFCL